MAVLKEPTEERRERPDSERAEADGCRFASGASCCLRFVAVGMLERCDVVALRGGRLDRGAWIRCASGRLSTVDRIIWLSGLGIVRGKIWREAQGTEGRIGGDGGNKTGTLDGS